MLRYTSNDITEIPISFNISMLFTQNLHALNASGLTITLEFQLTLPNTHAYKYMVLNRA
jgi:hypothetical protein